MTSPCSSSTPDRRALIEPRVARLPLASEQVPSAAVACFFQEVIRTECVVPGAPVTAGFLEEVLSLGVRAVVACGGAGVIKPGFDRSRVVLVSSAVRDEGTSYHYLPPSREITADPAMIARVSAVLERRGVRFTIGKTWTTHAIYRETRTRIARRLAEGCLTVEMEAAAFLAVATFRDVRFAQMLYGGDDVSGERWDPMRDKTDRCVRARLFDIAIDAALALAER